MRDDILPNGILTKKTHLVGLNIHPGYDTIIRSEKYRMPVYDVIMLISLGINIKAISEYLYKSYPELYTHKSGSLKGQQYNPRSLEAKVKKLIDNWFGSFKEAQEMFLMPVIYDLYTGFTVDGLELDEKTSLEMIYKQLKNYMTYIDKSWFQDFFIKGEVFLAYSLDKDAIRIEFKGLEWQTFGVPIHKWFKRVALYDRSISMFLQNMKWEYKAKVCDIKDIFNTALDIPSFKEEHFYLIRRIYLLNYINQHSYKECCLEFGFKTDKELIDHFDPERTGHGVVRYGDLDDIKDLAKMNLAELAAEFKISRELLLRAGYIDAKTSPSRYL